MKRQSAFRTLRSFAGMAIASSTLFGVTSLPGCVSQKPIWQEAPALTSELPAVKPVVEPARLHRTTLANGLQLIVLEDSRLPRVALGVAVRRGAGDEPRERAGLASLTAALMEREAGARGALALAQAVDERGAKLGVQAEWDSMNVEVAGLTRDLDFLFEILGDVTLRPVFSTEELRRIRANKIGALERGKDDPETLAHWAMKEVLYPEHRYGLPVEGSPSTLTAISQTEVRDFYAKVFVPSNAIFYAVGDLKFEDVLARANASFGAWKAGEVLAAGEAPPALETMQRKIVIVDRPDLVQSQLMLGHAGLARTSDDRLPVELMTRVFGGGGFSSRLMTKVRSDAGLTYSVYAAFDMRRPSGQFFVSTFTRVSETRRVVDLVLSEMARIQTEPVADTELGRVQNFAEGRFALGLETSDAVMGSLVNLAVYGLPEDSLDTYRRRVRSVSTADTERVAKQYLAPARASLAAVGPAKDLQPQLEALGPVTVVKPAEVNR